MRPLTADRSHVPPSGHTVFKLPGCYLCVFTVRRAEREGMWVPFFHKNLDYLETLGYHHGDFFSAGGVVQQGMVTVHPVGLPHGPKPASLKAFLDGKRPEKFDEVGSGGLPTPRRSPSSRGPLAPDYMGTGRLLIAERFGERHALDEVLALATRWRGACDSAPPCDEGAAP